MAAGRHRYEAAKRLKWKTIPATVLTRDEARAWQWTENNDRYNIDPLTESIGIVEGSRANGKLRHLVSAAPKGGKQPNDRGYSKLANKTGRSRKRITEAFLHYKLSRSIRDKIYQYPNLNQRTTLTLLAKMDTEKEQLEYIRNRKRSKSKSSSLQKRKIAKRKPVWHMGHSAAFRALRKIYENCSFKRQFEKQTGVVRDKFIKECLRPH